MKIKSFFAVLLSSSLVAACAQPGGPGLMGGGTGVNKQEVGTLVGAIGGGVIGSTMGSGKGRTAATIGGALLGGMLGSSLGAQLDKEDVAKANYTSQRALETAQPGQTLPWKNSQTGNSGSVTPSNYYKDANGQYCREFSHTINVGGKSEKGYGTACRQPDGSWQIVGQ